MEVNLGNLGQSKKEPLVYYIMRDHFSGNLALKITSKSALLPLVDFLYYAWGEGEDKHLGGMPENIWVPKTVDQAAPGLFAGLATLGVEPAFPPSGFASGVRVIRDLEDSLCFFLGRLSEHTIENVNNHLEPIYRHLLSLSFGDNKVNKWRDNLPAGQPKAPPAYPEFLSNFREIPSEKYRIPLLPSATQPKAAAKRGKKPDMPPAPLPEFNGDKLDQAQDLIYEAWESPSRIKRLALAKEALRISPYCAAAYNLMAKESDVLQEKTQLYVKALEVGKISLGERCFQEDVGFFWGLVETRPYMRALNGLAECHWKAGRLAETIELYREMLRLNPNDNQGARYPLISCLLEEGRWDETEEFLREWGDEASCFMEYSRALLSFAVSGKDGQADEYLKKAFASNEFVPSYLTGERIVPFILPDYYGFGDDDEAAIYADLALKAWRKTPGAVDWVRVKEMRRK